MGFGKILKKVGSFVKDSVSNPIGLIAPGLSKTIVGKGVRTVASIGLGGAVAPLATGGLSTLKLKGGGGGLFNRIKDVKNTVDKIGGLNNKFKDTFGVSGRSSPIYSSPAYNNNYSSSRNVKAATRSTKSSEVATPVKIGFAAAIAKIFGII